jgi:hypothetical protein
LTEGVNEAGRHGNEREVSFNQRWIATESVDEIL